jgi:hypothetical protein
MNQPTRATARSALATGLALRCGTKSTSEPELRLADEVSDYERHGG